MRFSKAPYVLVPDRFRERDGPGINGNALPSYFLAFLRQVPVECEG